MKNAPFLVSSSVGLLAVVLSFWSFGVSQSNNRLQNDLLTKQTELQGLNTSVTALNSEAQQLNEIIASKNNLEQRVATPILGRMGYLAAKNKNEEFKKILTEFQFDKKILTDKEVQEIDDANAARIKQQAEAMKQQGAATPGGATPKAPAPTTPTPPQN